MKAYLNDCKGLGTDHTTITRDYKTYGMMYRHAIVPFLKNHGGMCKAEIFYNWDNRYGTPNLVDEWRDGKYITG